MHSATLRHPPVQRKTFLPGCTVARKPDKRTIGYQGESEEGEIIYEVIFDQVAVRRMAAPYQANYEHSAVVRPQTEERS